MASRRLRLTIDFWLGWVPVRHERTVLDRSWYFGFGKVTVNR